MKEKSGEGGHKISEITEPLILEKKVGPNAWGKREKKKA